MLSYILQVDNNWTKAIENGIKVESTFMPRMYSTAQGNVARKQAFTWARIIKEHGAHVSILSVYSWVNTAV